MGRRPYVRFYHMDWAASGDVSNMSMAEVGVYWTLLVRQMVDGYVPADRDKLRRPLNVDTVEEVNALMTPLVTSKFEPLNGDPTRLYNKRLAEVIEETDAASTRGRANVGGRYDYRTAALEDSLPGGAKLDYAAAWKAFPKRKNPSEGYSEGMRLLREVITTDEDYRLFMAAVKNYARSCAKAGHDKQFTKRLDRFMNEWRDHLPKELQAVPEAEAPQPALQVVKDGEPQRARRVLPKGDVPPWTPGYGASEREKQWLAAYWTPDRQERWWNGEDLTAEGVAFSAQWSKDHPAASQEATQ